MIRSMERRRRRIRLPSPPKPTSIIDHTAGSGTPGPVRDTPSSRATGGRPVGVPIDRKLSTSLELVAVKVRVTVIQPWKCCEGLSMTAVSKVTPPRLYSICSVVSPVRSANCETAQSKLKV